MAMVLVEAVVAMVLVEAGVAVVLVEAGVAWCWWSQGYKSQWLVHRGFYSNIRFRDSSFSAKKNRNILMFLQT